MQQWMQTAHQFERQYGIPQGLLVALIRGESGGNPNAHSPAGAIGYGQLMPSTARSLGVDPYDPIDNLRGSAMYLSQQLRAFNGNPQLALAAYNAGPGAVRSHNGVPPYKETQGYVSRVMGYWGGSSGAPVGAAQNGSQVGQSVDPSHIARIQYAYADDPTIANILVQREMNKAQPGSAPGMTGPTPAGAAVLPRKPGELAWQYLQRLGGSLFGLRNDPGNSQATGGNHTNGSQHYSGTAIDFGDARNSWDQLNNWYNWVNQHKNELGVTELLNEGDHIHVGLARSMRPTNAPVPQPPTLGIPKMDRRVRPRKAGT